MQDSWINGGPYFWECLILQKSFFQCSPRGSYFTWGLILEGALFYREYGMYVMVNLRNRSFREMQVGLLPESMHFLTACRLQSKANLCFSLALAWRRAYRIHQDLYYWKCRHAWMQTWKCACSLMRNSEKTSLILTAYKSTCIFHNDSGNWAVYSRLFRNLAETCRIFLHF